MRWVDVNEQLPIPQRRVLVAMHAGTEWEFKAVGVFCWDHRDETGKPVSSR